MQVIQVNTAGQATVLEALMVSHKVEISPVCTSELGIECIDGVCNNPETNKWWTIEVNGDYQSVNSQTVVHPSDRVVLKYASSKGK